MNSARPRAFLVAFGLAAAALALVGAAALVTHACPFCGPAMQTLSEEIKGADSAIIAELITPMPALPASSEPGIPAFDPAAAATFGVVETLRGEEKLAGAKEIAVVYFGEAQPKKKFLITGIAAITPDKLEWTTPVPLSDRAAEYVRKLSPRPAEGYDEESSLLPAEGADRLAFFQDYLEDDDPLLAQDSYDEFARAPYSDVVALGPRMNRDKVLAWINDPSVGPTGRRLYLTMLGICGKPEDVGMLEEFLHYDYQLMKPALAAALSTGAMNGATITGAGLLDEAVHAEERRKKESLDALIACYLKLKGPEGLELVNQKFLSNPSAEFKYLHSAIMALRFHGEETDILPREKLLESMRLALSHRDFADQIIPDLTRWEDWDVMPRLVKMAKEAPSDDYYIRQAVVSYLLVAEEQPGEVGSNGKAALAEFEAMDPETVERARSLQAFSFLAKAAAPPTAAATPAGPAVASASNPTTPGPASPNTSAQAASAASAAPETTLPVTAQAAPGPAAKNPPRGASPLAAAPLPAPSRLKMIGVPLLSATVLLAIFAVLLRGTDPRSSAENS